jgi:tryptophanyl-tRNA synthetase
VASRFNHQMGETFVIPEARFKKTACWFLVLMVVKWVNQLIILLIYSWWQGLRKQIMGIETDSTPLEEPKPRYL